MARKCHHEPPVHITEGAASIPDTVKVTIVSRIAGKCPECGKTLLKYEVVTERA